MNSIARWAVYVFRSSGRWNFFEGILPVSHGKKKNESNSCIDDSLIDVGVWLYWRNHVVHSDCSQNVSLSSHGGRHRPHRLEIPTRLSSIAIWHHNKFIVWLIALLLLADYGIVVFGTPYYLIQRASLRKSNFVDSCHSRENMVLVMQ